MTEGEKVTWKVEVFKQVEDTDDYIQKKMENLE